MLRACYGTTVTDARVDLPTLINLLTQPKEFNVDCNRYYSPLQPLQLHPLPGIPESWTTAEQEPFKTERLRTTTSPVCP
jgi:hypothetical protein